MFTLWGPGVVAGLSKGSCSLLKPRMTSMLWTRPPTATPPPLPSSWKLLGERQLSSTMLMVSSDKCIRASGQSPGPGVEGRCLGEATQTQITRSPRMTVIHLNLIIFFGGPEGQNPIDSECSNKPLIRL